MPALVIHGTADRTVSPANAVFLVRQFLLFNGVAPDELPAGAALPPAQVRPFQSRASDYLLSEHYAGRRLAVQWLSVPGLGHAWSGGDPAYPFFEDHRLDATALICKFFESHAARA